MADIVEVVRVKRDGAMGGFVEINKSDLTDKDVLYGASEDKALNAHDMIELINACKSLGDLEDVLADGEKRQGVLNAYDKKANALTEGD